MARDTGGRLKANIEPVRCVHILKNRPRHHEGDPPCNLTTRSCHLLRCTGGSLCADAVSLGKHEVTVHQPAIVNELWLAQRHKDVCNQGRHTFKKTCSGEKPAKATLSLMLHGSHHTPRRPVHRSGQQLTIMAVSSGAVHARRSQDETCLRGRNFRSREIGENVTPQLKREFLSIGDAHALDVSLEIPETHGLFVDTIAHQYSHIVSWLNGSVSCFATNTAAVMHEQILMTVQTNWKFKANPDD